MKSKEIEISEAIKNIRNVKSAILTILMVTFVFKYIKRMY